MSWSEARGNRGACVDYRAASVAVLRFSFGTMGSGKSTLALQIHHNLASRGLKGLLITMLDREGAQVSSRLGVSAPAVNIDPSRDLFELASLHSQRHPLSFVVCDARGCDCKTERHPATN